MPAGRVRILGDVVERAELPGIGFSVCCASVTGFDPSPALLGVDVADDAQDVQAVGGLPVAEEVGGVVAVEGGFDDEVDAALSCSSMSASLQLGR